MVINSLAKAKPLMYQMMMKSVQEDLDKQRNENSSLFKSINEQIVGAEIIYATPDSFYLCNPETLKRFVVKVGDWQIRPF